MSVAFSIVCNMAEKQGEILQYFPKRRIIYGCLSQVKEQLGEWNTLRTMRSWPLVLHYKFSVEWFI